MQATLKLRILDAASQPYRIAGTFQYRMARGKLGGDPLFTYLLEYGVLRNSRRVMNLGCGRGLLAAWFLAAEKLAAARFYGGSTADERGHAVPQCDAQSQF